MAGFTGMDIGQVRNLAAQMRQKAEEIEGIANQLTQALNSAQWVGPDKQKFEGDWNSQYRQQLRQVCDGLKQAAGIADQNAKQQEDASNA